MVKLVLLYITLLKVAVSKNLWKMLSEGFPDHAPRPMTGDVQRLEQSRAVDLAELGDRPASSYPGNRL